MKVSGLTDAKLDYWVAKALGRWDANHEFRITFDGHSVLIAPAISCDDNSEDFSPSTLWAHGGPIIEAKRLHCIPAHGPDGDCWASFADDWGTERVQYGEIPLRAAMRALVASVYGDEVPDEADAGVPVSPLSPEYKEAQRAMNKTAGHRLDAMHVVDIDKNV